MPDEPNQPSISPEKLQALWARSRMSEPEADVSAEVVEQLAREESEARQAVREQRKNDLLEGDVVVDPELLEVGDEVAEEVVSEFKRFNDHKTERVLLYDEFFGKKVHGSVSKFSPEEQRSACQRVADLMFEHQLSKTAATEIVGSELGVSPPTVSKWAENHGIEFPVPEQKRKAVERWDLVKREELFDRELSISSLLLDRMMVYLQNPEEAPEDWNAANELKTIAVASAIAHDKRTGIEDLKTQRGIRDLDSEELQNELSEGKQRLLEMGGGGV